MSYGVSNLPFSPRYHYVYEILKGAKPASTRGTADEVRVGDKSQDGEADRPNDPAGGASPSE
jgi:hypothetical protein